MYPSSCPRCRGPIDAGFRFCKSCGCDLAYPNLPPQQPAYYPQQSADTGEKQGINLLILALGVKYASVVLSVLVMRFLVALNFYNGLNLLSMVFSLLTTIGLLVFAILAKNKRAKLFLWIFFGIELLTVVYRFSFSNFFGVF
jgi:hypothetical protein